MSDFPVRDYTQEQNGGSTMKMAVSVSKYCWDAEIFYHGNVTSHFSLSWWK